MENDIHKYHIEMKSGDCVKCGHSKEDHLVTFPPMCMQCGCKKYVPVDGGPIPTLLHGSNIPENAPIPNSNPAVWDLVIEDIRKRDEMGTRKYHTRLQPFNGRDPLWDAYQEALDLVVYLRQTIFERDNVND